MTGIYKITSPSGRVYIGQSVNIEKRITAYKMLRCKRQRRLYNSFNKYGVNAHIFEVIEECEVGQLNNREGYWQDFYDSVNNGLNCIRVGSDNQKSYFCEETKKRVIDATSFITWKNSLEVLDTKTNKTYTTIKQASKELNISYTTLKDILKFGRHEQYKHLVYLKEELRPEYSFLPQNKNMKLVLDTQTGVFFYSAKEASITYNIKHSTLISILNGTNPNNTSLVYA